MWGRGEPTKPSVFTFTGPDERGKGSAVEGPGAKKHRAAQKGFVPGVPLLAGSNPASTQCSFDFSRSLRRDLSPPLQAQSSRKGPPSPGESLQIAGGEENCPWSSELWRRVLGPARTTRSTDETADSPWHLGEGDMSLSHPECHLSVLIHSWPRGLRLLVQHRCAGTEAVGS